jgi:Right handed beta helix region
VLTTCRRNLVGYSSDTSCVVFDASNNPLVEGNEFIGRGSLLPGPQAGVAFLGVSGATVRGNLVREAFGAGVRGFDGNSAGVIENNTITANGQGGFATAGVLWPAAQGTATTGMTVRRNVITANAGPGIQVTGGAGGANVANQITENEIFGNGGSGIDLAAVGTPDELTVDGPTLNDPVTAIRAAKRSRTSRSSSPRRDWTAASS